MKIYQILFILTSALVCSCNIPDQIEQPPRKVYKMEYQWPPSTVIQLEKDLNIIKDLDQGIQKARVENKPILLVFAAVGSVHCRKYEEEILKDEQLLSLMKNNFVNVWLWVDDKRGEWRKWSRLQFREFKGNYQPHIFILDQNGQITGGDIEYNAARDNLLLLLLKHIKEKE